MTVLRTFALPASIARLGDIVQLAFMARDFEAGLRFWSGTMGAGPFFVIDHVKFAEARYRGALARLDLAVGIGYWGDLQIEFVHQHNDAPSIFLDWQKDGREGLHHIGILVGDIAMAERVCADAGATVLLEGTMAGGRGRFFYAGMAEPAPFLEVIEPTGKLLKGFEYMRDAARNWDGRDPIRRTGSPAGAGR